MKLRRLGQSGPMVSVIGMGCWAIGGASAEWGWGVQDDKASEDAIRQAVELGVNWFDTAPTYGLGHSELVLGRALKDVRHDVVIATKFGRTWDEDGHLGISGRYDWIVQECEASLKRLGTDYIDLYQMHWPDTETRVPVEESMRAATDLISAGKVRYAGVCNFDVSQLERAVAACPLVSVQPRYNLLDRAAESDLIPFCRERGLGVVAYSVLASGLLGGRLRRDSRLSPGDWRLYDPEFIGQRFLHNLAVIERLRLIGRDLDLDIASLAVAWVLRDPAVTSAIVGIRKPDHIRGIVAAADHELTVDALTRIDTVLAEAQAG